VLDYLSDFVCVLYGRPAVYGVVTLPSSVREGINIFLDGHIPTENLRFREESLTFRIAEAGEDLLADKARAFSYPSMEKTMGSFHLKIEPGKFTDSEILVLVRILFHKYFFLCWPVYPLLFHSLIVDKKDGRKWYW